MAPPPSTTPNSRSSSVHMETQQQTNQQPQQNNQNDTQVKGFATIASTNVSGNEMPGYPLQPGPQSSHNSNGYPGYIEMGQQPQQQANQWQNQNQNQQQMPRQPAVSDASQSALWSDTNSSSKMGNNGMTWSDNRMQKIANENMQIQGQQELPRPASHMSWENGSGKEPQTPQSWQENSENQQMQASQPQANWPQQSPKIREVQNPRLTPSSQPQSQPGWPQHSPKLPEHQNPTQNPRMTPSNQHTWPQNSPELQGQNNNHQNPRLTPSNQQQNQQWQQSQTKLDQNPRLTPSNQMSWPDTPTSQPNWSPNSMKSDGSQQPQQPWPDSQPSPRRTPGHQPAAWQNQSQNQNQETKMEQMNWSPSSAENQNWGQQNNKQDMQNSGERILWQDGKSNGYLENQDQASRVTLNSRLKSMILNKQQAQQQQQQQQQQQHQQQQQQQMQQQMNHGHHQVPQSHQQNPNGSNEFPTDDRIRDSHENNDKMQEKRPEQYMNQQMMPMSQPNEQMTGNFLLHSHHPRADSLPDGGGLWEWTGGGNNVNNNQQIMPETGITAIQNFIKYNEDKSTDYKKDQNTWENNQTEHNKDNKSFQERLGIVPGEESKIDNQMPAETPEKDINKNEKPNGIDFYKNPEDGNIYDSNQKIKQETDYSCPEEIQESGLPKTIKTEPDQGESENDYKFRGDGGPVKLSATGSWCCRRGGTEQPTPEHLRDGCCQGLQTRDEIIEEAPEKTTEVKNESPGSPKTITAGSKLQDHLDKLKNNVRTEVPDCDCFPADKCELQLCIQHNTNIERTH